MQFFSDFSLPFRNFQTKNIHENSVKFVYEMEKLLEALIR